MIWAKCREFVSQRYPYYYHGKNLLFFIGLFFAMALGFNYFFQPFNVYVPEHRMDYFWISVIHSFTPIIILCLLAFLYSRFPKAISNWTISKELGFFFFLLLGTGIIQFLIRDIIYDNPRNWSWRYLFEEITNTLMVGFLFASILIPINLNRLLIKGLSQNKTSNPEIQSHGLDATENMIFIKTQVQSDDFWLDPQDFNFAKSDGNYTELHILHQGANQKLIKRITLKQLLDQLKDLTVIVQTHRSYLVNIQRIAEVRGNAQGYRLRLTALSVEIPVSRKMIAQFDSQLMLNQGE